MKEIQQKALLVSGGILLKNPEVELHIEQSQKEKKKNKSDERCKDFDAEKKHA